MSGEKFSLIEVIADDGEEILGWGVELPSGRVYIEWNRQRFPIHQRLKEVHISEYGTLGDVEQATGGVPRRVITQPVNREVDYAKQ